jgi:hypothetical protein
MMNNKRVKFIQMDVTYYGNHFPKSKYYLTRDDGLVFFSSREDDGLWLGLDIDEKKPINVYLFNFEGRWNTNCEYCEQGKGLVYKNDYCEIRKGELYVKPTTRGRKKEII